MAKKRRNKPKKAPAAAWMSRRGVWLAAVLVVAVAGGVAWYYLGAGNGGGGAGVAGCAVEGRIFVDAGDADLLIMGRRTYAENCAACHGDELQGQPNWRRRLPDGTLPAPPHDVNGHTWHHPDRQLFVITKCGGGAVSAPGFKSAMPGFADSLSDREIIASLAFIKSFWPRQIRQRQELLSRQNP